MEGQFDDGTPIPDGYTNAMATTPRLFRPILRRRVHKFMQGWASRPQDGGGGEAGVREPRRPLPPSGLMSAALEPRRD